MPEAPFSGYHPPRGLAVRLHSGLVVPRERMGSPASIPACSFHDAVDRFATFKRVNLVGDLHHTLRAQGDG